MNLELKDLNNLVEAINQTPNVAFRQKLQKLAETMIDRMQADLENQAKGTGRNKSHKEKPS
jgi:hypothetical protein